MAPYFTHSILDRLSCPRTQWIVVKVMIEHSLHSVLICNVHTLRFPLECSLAAVCPCVLIRVRCRPHSEGCEGAVLGEEVAEQEKDWGSKALAGASGAE